MMNVPAEPTVNEVIDPVKAIENYKRENKYLRDELALHDALVNRNGMSYEALSEQQLYEIENQCRRYIDGTLDEIEVKNLRQVQGLLLETFFLFLISKNKNFLFVAIFNIFRNICR
jgi:kinesin family protein 6/9